MDVEQYKKCCKREKWVPTYIANIDNEAENPLSNVEVKIEFEDVVKSAGDLYHNGKIRTNKFTQGVYSIISRISMGRKRIIRPLNISFKAKLKVNGYVIDADLLRTRAERGSILLSINYPLNPGDKLCVTVEVSGEGDMLEFLQPTFLSVVRLYSL